MTGSRRATDVVRVPEYGDVWWADLGTPLGHEAAFRRPVVIISAAHALHLAGLVIVCPFTRTHTGYPTNVKFEPHESGLSIASFVQVEHLRTISTERLVELVGALDDASLARIVHVLRLILPLS